MLDRSEIRGHFGETLLAPYDDDDDVDDEADHDEDVERVLDSRPLPDRRIYSIDFRDAKDVEPFVEEIQRIVEESKQHTAASNGNGEAAVDLMQWIQGQPNAEQLERYLSPAGNVAQLNVDPGRRWYPVIDYSRCTKLFGVYRLLSVWCVWNGRAGCDFR